MKIVSWILACGLVWSCRAAGGDSPQFRGAERTGVFQEQGLLKAWPAEGPPVAWVAKGLGQGFSSASVADGKVYITGMSPDETGWLYTFNLDGTLETKLAYGRETPEKQAPGSRSTPTIDGERLYFLSGPGVLYCVDRAKNAVLWQVNILERFQAELPMWHIAESVLVDGERVICTPGGKDAAVAALNKMTGETVWKTAGLTDTTSYCSPIIVNHQGRRVLLAETGKYILGADPDNGKLLWSFGQTVPWDIHAVTPVYQNGQVYFVGGDGAGGGVLEMAPDASSVQLKWSDTVLDCLHHGVVLVDGHLYGAGYKTRELVCLELAAGRVVWRSKEIGEAVTVAADGMLYTYEGPKSGMVSLVKATPAGFERTGSFLMAEGDGKHWAHPTIAHGRLYIRHGDALAVYDIAAK